MVHNTEPSDAIDHWDRNTLNDSPANLLNGGQSWNGRNKVVTSKTGYRGVLERKNKSGSVWWASLNFDGKTIYLGTYATPEEAAAAYEEARMQFKPHHSATVKPDATQYSRRRLFTHMPLQHGSKLYCQLLIDPHRYKLAEKLAAEENKRVTAMLREMVYAALEKAVPASDYKAAKAADEAAWAESVQRRVQGRMRSKQEGKVSETDA